MSATYAHAVSLASVIVECALQKPRLLEPLRRKVTYWPSPARLPDTLESAKDTEHKDAQSRKSAEDFEVHSLTCSELSGTAWQVAQQASESGVGACHCPRIFILGIGSF